MHCDKSSAPRFVVIRRGAHEQGREGVVGTAPIRTGLAPSMQANVPTSASDDQDCRRGKECRP